MRLLIPSQSTAGQRASIKSTGQGFKKAVLTCFLGFQANDYVRKQLLNL
jgi:hypothetical protein